jgi:hypothetical protein
VDAEHDPRSSTPRAVKAMAHPKPKIERRVRATQSLANHTSCESGCSWRVIRLA